MRAYERFMRYIQFETASDEKSESCPSTPNQLVLGRELVREMQEMGLQMRASMQTAMFMAAFPPTRRACPPSG